MEHMVTQQFVIFMFPLSMVLNCGISLVSLIHQLFFLLPKQYISCRIPLQHYPVLIQND